MMENEILLNKIVDKINEGDGKMLLEHLEKTEGKERIIAVVAKSISLVLLVLGGMIALCMCAYHIDNISEVLKIVSPIVSGVLSFFAGRSSRLNC